MAMPESVENMGRGPRTIDNRQGIRQRRAVAHPLPPTFRLQTGQECRRLGEHRLGTRIVRRPPQTAEFHCSAYPNSRFKRRNHEAMSGKRQLSAHIESAGRKRRIVSALRFKRNAIAKPPGESMRPCAGGNHQLLRQECSPIRGANGNSLRARLQLRHVCRTEGRPAALGIGPKSLPERARIRDGLPCRKKCRELEAFRKTRLKFRQLLPADMAKRYLEPTADLPHRRGGLKFIFAFV